jgi:competence protein ComEA
LAVFHFKGIAINPTWIYLYQKKGMWEAIREYLTFTKKERFGVLFLLLLISVLFILPHLFKPVPGDPDPAANIKFKEDIKKWKSQHPDSAQHEKANKPYSTFVSSAAKEGINLSPYRGVMHDFDPNTMKEGDWVQLGLPGRVSLTISRYIEKGGRFRKPEDLKKIYGLKLSDYERLLPYVHIGRGVNYSAGRTVSPEYLKYNAQHAKKPDSVYAVMPDTKRRNTYSFYSGKKLELTDINLSDSANWAGLPGIGARLAARIIHFREKLGGFYQIDQVGETFGLPDSTFQKLKPVLRLSALSLVQLDINNASKEMLQAHPYIGWQLAKAIVTFRNQHGRFRTVDELLQLAQLDTLRFGKLKPYLIVYP